MINIKSGLVGPPGYRFLIQKNIRGFAGLGSKRKPTKKDLDKYDVIVVGGNLGGIFSRHFDQVANKKATNYTMMAVFDNTINQQYPIRGVYEQQRASKTDYLLNAKLAINMYTAHSDTIGVEKFLPEENAIVLRNGRRIGYEQLVIAMGINEDFDAIKGFDEAWKDAEHPVYTCKDHPLWRSSLHKYPRWHYNFVSGDAYFVIPPYPYKGEIGGFNFFISNEIWKWYLSHGKLSPKHSFTIVNANDRFCQYFDQADTFIKEKLQKSGIKVEYGLKLVEVDQGKQLATFENLKTKERQVRPYNNLYALPPSKPHSSLLQAGLVSSETNYLLDVDQQTLRHKKYNNIFGLGDINNLPTTKSFWGGFHQLHVVRNNVYRNLKGQSLNGLYSGYSKSVLHLGQNTLTYVTHYYDQKPALFNMLGKDGGLISKIRYYYWGKNQKKKFLGLYLFKSWGPPTFKFKKTFPELKSTQEAEVPKDYSAVNRAETAEPKSH